MMILCVNTNLKNLNCKLCKTYFERQYRSCFLFFTKMLTLLNTDIFGVDSAGNIFIKQRQAQRHSVQYQAW